VEFGSKRTEIRGITMTLLIKSNRFLIRKEETLGKVATSLLKHHTSTLFMYSFTMPFLVNHSTKITGGNKT